MSYHVRRFDREITDENELKSIMERGKYGIIGLSRDNEPYVVTLNYGYDKAGNALFFHCGKEGQKIDFIKSNPRACVTIIEDNGFDVNSCEHKYKSVILHGKICLINDAGETGRAMRLMIMQLEKKAPEKLIERLKTGNRDFDNLQILKFTIDKITGKKKESAPDK